MYNFDEFCRSYLKDRIKVMQTLTKKQAWNASFAGDDGWKVEFRGA